MTIEKKLIDQVGRRRDGRQTTHRSAPPLLISYPPFSHTDYEYEYDEAHHPRESCCRSLHRPDDVHDIASELEARHGYVSHGDVDVTDPIESHLRHADEGGPNRKDRVLRRPRIGALDGVDQTTSLRRGTVEHDASESYHRHGVRVRDSSRRMDR